MNGYRYRGEDAKGRAHFGSLAPGSDVWQFTDDRFRAGWRSLVVTTGDGETVGAIEPRENGRRGSWARRPDGLRHPFTFHHEQGC